jgi:hypothetical protein
MTDKQYNDALSDILTQSMRQSFLKAAKLARQTNTALVIYNGHSVECLMGDDIDNHLKNIIDT